MERPVNKKQGQRIKKLRSFRVKRLSSGPFSGTCATLTKVTNAMGKDIAGWLADESAGSLLGDAR